ncbi:MAG: hypothetical protein IKY64_09840 [Bacteroidaceae bacterium]|nr:hypothetical protein [Bacteroidaceae bacterium]
MSGNKIFNNCTFGVIADTVHSMSVTISPDGSMTVNAMPVVEEAEAEVMDVAPLPEVLLSDEARTLHAKLMDAGMVDEGWMPVGLSNAEKGTLAEYLTERLNISTKWKMWGALWGINPETLRTSKARGLDQEKTWAFRSRLEAL